MLGTVLNTKHTMVNKMGTEIPALRELPSVCIYVDAHTPPHLSVEENPGEGGSEKERKWNAIARVSWPCMRNWFRTLTLTGARPEPEGCGGTEHPPAPFKSR